jgi:hypothetical protein
MITMDRKVFEEALIAGGYGEERIVDGMNGFRDYVRELAYYRFKGGVWVAALFLEDEVIDGKDSSKVENVCAIAVPRGFALDDHDSALVVNFGRAAEKIHGYKGGIVGGIGITYYPTFFDDSGICIDRKPEFNAPGAATSNVKQVVPMLNSLATCRDMLTKYFGAIRREEKRIIEETISAFQG